MRNERMSPPKISIRQCLIIRPRPIEATIKCIKEAPLLNKGLNKRRYDTPPRRAERSPDMNTAGTRGSPKYINKAYVM